MDEVPPEPAPLAEGEESWQVLHTYRRHHDRHSRWLENLGLAYEFYRLKGRIPHISEFYGGIDVGIWLYDQKLRLPNLRDERLKNARIVALKACGIWDSLTEVVINPNVTAWEKAFAKLVLFMRRSGRVPRYRDTLHADDDPKRFKIGVWFFARSKNTTPDRLERLEMLISQYTT